MKTTLTNLKLIKYGSVTGTLNNKFIEFAFDADGYGIYAIAFENDESFRMYGRDKSATKIINKYSEQVKNFKFNN